MRQTPIHFGKGLNPELSNFWPSKIIFHNREFACAEGAYQAFKSGFYVSGFEKLDGPASKRKAKELGLKRHLTIDLMRDILEARYEQDSTFRVLLDDAGQITHPVGDHFWSEWFPRLLNQLRDKHKTKEAE